MIASCMGLAADAVKAAAETPAHTDREDARDVSASLAFQRSGGRHGEVG